VNVSIYVKSWLMPLGSESLASLWLWINRKLLVVMNRSRFTFIYF